MIEPLNDNPIMGARDIVAKINELIKHANQTDEAIKDFGTDVYVGSIDLYKHIAEEDIRREKIAALKVEDEGLIVPQEVIDGNCVCDDDGECSYHATKRMQEEREAKEPIDSKIDWKELEKNWNLINEQFHSYEREDREIFNWFRNMINKSLKK